MNRICPSYVPDMSQKCPRYFSVLSQMCPRYKPDMSQIRQRYVSSLKKGWLTWASSKFRVKQVSAQRWLYFGTSLRSLNSFDNWDTWYKIHRIPTQSQLLPSWTLTNHPSRFCWHINFFLPNIMEIKLFTNYISLGYDSISLLNWYLHHTSFVPPPWSNNTI